jgi:NitT/TauT family transport system substrate-binding protein
MKYVIIGLVVAMLGGGAIFYGQQAKKEAERKREEERRVKIVVGIPFIPGFMPSLFAKEKGFLDAEKIDADFIDTYPSYGEMPKEFAAGKYDIVALSNSVFAASPDVYNTGKVGLLGYHSLEGSAIVARKGIDSLDVARGKTIAVVPGGDFLAYWALRAHGIPLKNVKVVTGTWSSLADDILAGKYDYAYLAAPQIERYVTQGGGKVVYSAKDDVGSVTTAYTFSDKFLEEHHDAAVGFVRAYFKALEYARAHPEEFRDFIVKVTKVTPTEADAYLLNGSHFINARENLAGLTPGFGIKNFGGNIRYIQEYFAEIGRGPQVDLESRIESKLIIEAGR